MGTPFKPQHVSVFKNKDMKKPSHICIVLTFLPLCLLSCSHFKEVNKDVKPIVEKLYLNVKALDNVYHHLHELAQIQMHQSDQQLNHIQKSYLFLNEAKLICHYQWKLLSITPYISESSRIDYHTLLRSDLQKAISEVKFRITLLELYSAYMTHKSARNLLKEGIGLLQGCTYMFDKLQNRLKPVSHKPKTPKL
jgi:hypothetical protein